MNGEHDITVRELGLGDIDYLLRWRMEVLETVFAEDGPWDADALLEANRRYYEHALGTTHHAFVAALDGVDVGCGGICLQDEMPSPDNPSGRCAYLMNIYTREVARGNHVGTAMVMALVDKARRCGAGKVYLEATDMGAPLYAHLGFAPMDGMMKLVN